MDVPIPGPLRLGDLLDRAFRLYRARLWSLLLTGALVLVPFAVVSGLLTGQTYTSFFDLMRTTSPRRGPSTTDLLGMVAGLSALMAFLAVAGGLVFSLATLALTHHSIVALHGRPVSAAESLRRALGRLLPFIGMAILQGLAMLAAAVAVLVPLAILVGMAVVGLALIAGAGQREADAVAGAIAVLVILGAFLIGIVLVLIPLLYLSARWIAAVPGLVAERLGPVQALRRSWALTRGQVWRCIGYLLLLGLIQYIVASLPAGLFQFALTLALGPNELGWTTGLSTAFTYVLYVAALPLQMAAMVLLYYDLRVRREGYDLALRVERLEAQVAAQRDAPATGETPA